MNKIRLVRENRFLGIGFNPKHPLPSVANYLKIKAGAALKSESAWGYPIHVTIEPASICNLRCPLCPAGTRTLGRPEGMMSLAQFRSIVDEIKGSVLKLEIAGMGEPFVNPDLCRMIRYAADAGMWVRLNTNATLIDSEEKVRDLVGSGLRLLNMSIDGATQATYEKYRVGGDLDAVIRNVRAIVEEKRRRGLDCPEIVCQVVVTRNNEEELEDIRRLADALGADRFVAKTATLALVRQPGDADIPEKLLNGFAPRNADLRRHKPKQDAGLQNGCPSLYKSAFIMWNGDLSTCCHDARGINRMGNIFEAGSFGKVWNSPRYRQLRRQVNTDIRKAEPLCCICPARVTAD